MKVSNRKCIRRLSLGNMRAARGRNGIAVFAIVLTTVLFTTLFTIAMSINFSIQQANFRQVGSYAHGSYKYLTREQAEELMTDPAIKRTGLRLFVGMPTGEPFNKAHVEVGYSDETGAELMFLQPVEGRLPAEGTDEAATDTRVLALLGVEPELGAPFTMTFDVDGQETTQTFTLSGWWDYDSAITASHVLLPQSRAGQIFDQLDTRGTDGITGTWSMDIMLASTVNIEQRLEAILQDHGYQSEQYGEPDYIATGVNAGYTGAQVSGGADPLMVIGVGLLLLIIIFTGYLIIYNVFLISVTGDIRFYGLLKAIGTTGRQLKRLIRIQALTLSAVGIPLGLLAGYVVGVRLTPVILNRLDGVMADAVSVSPLIFILSAVFALVTVLISCRKPGKIAARVSPVEAVRYTEGNFSKKTLRKAGRGASLPKMAWANLGRSRSKTVVTLISLSLAVLLLNLTVTLSNAFDMDKYLRNMAADFIVADAGQFQAGNYWSGDAAVSEEVIGQLHEQGGITGGGRTYGLTTSVQELVSEDHFRSTKWWYPEDIIDQEIARQRQEDGLISSGAQLYGMEQYVLDKLTVLEGDLSKLYAPGGRYVAAVYFSDDYGNPQMDSHWAEVGETITLRYVEEWEYYDTETGEMLDEVSDDGRSWAARASSWRDVEYEVAVLVTVPLSLSYRFSSDDEFILNDQTFMEDTGTASIMYYAFDTTEAANAGMESFLRETTETRLTGYDYESRETYAGEFEALRSMFTILGGVLSVIVGAVGVLNFLNAILTGILARRREFAVLQSVGMTGRQLRTMLIWEGLYYTLGAVLVSLALCIAASPLLDSALGGVFWFFTFRFTIWPVLALAPVFACLGAALPLLSCRLVERHSVVERLREAE